MARGGAAETSSVARALALLAAFRPRDRELTAAELARRSGLARSTAYRLAGELAGLGMLEQTLGGRFRLGMKLFELGQLALYQQGLRESASSFLADLSNATRQTSHLAVLDGFEVVYLDIIRPSSSPRLRSRIGGRLPATVTGVGKAILAFSPPELVDQVLSAGLPSLTSNSITDEQRLRAELAKVRRSGLAFDHQEQAVGTSCCAAPVFGSGKKVVGAVSVSGHTSSIRLDLVSAAVQSAAAGISRVQGAGNWYISP
ncbi:MAG: IclR family transcriptional regulator [Propionibacteriaceae bacterium]|jgi:DNA-binding IclR family transcriptional regulator|nr:IclR family transcriptional regulator [Propionibacteriaceae bacterium]